MDWIIGLATVVIVMGGGALLAYISMEHSKTAEKPTSKPDYQAAMATQANDADRRFRSAGPTWDEWLDKAARRLMQHWPTVSYDEARAMIREYMDDIAVYPDPAFDWSFAAADETADEYMREYGEMHGANS